MPLTKREEWLRHSYGYLGQYPTVRDFGVWHTSFKCGNRRQCGLSKCTKHLNRLLHADKSSENSHNVKCQESTSASGGDISTITLTNQISDNPSVTTIVDDTPKKGTLYKFLPVLLRGPKGCAKVIAFIDDGSNISLLEDTVANKIGLHGPLSNLSLGWIGGKKSNEMSKTLNMEISGIHNQENSFSVRNVRTISYLKLPSQTLHFEKFKEKFSSLLDKVIVDDYIDATPKLLIGLPHIRLDRPQRVVNLDNDFSVHQTALYNILFGSNEETPESILCVIDADELHKQVSEYFTLESFGMKVVNPITSEDDKRAEAILATTTVKIENRYVTGLLWRQNDFNFIEIVEAKMNKDKDFAEWYINKINEYTLKGYARKLTRKEIDTVDTRTWHLPHFVITNVNKGNKRRLVFDAAARVDGESFNPRLMKGPCKYQPKPLLCRYTRNVPSGKNSGTRSNGTKIFVEGRR